MLRKSVILPFLAATSLATGAIAQEITADTIVATVGGTDITIGHMIVLRDGLPDQYRQLPDEVLFPGILDQLVQQTVLSQSYEGTDYAINLRTENEERRLRAGRAIEAAVAQVVTPQALEALYQERYSEVTPSKEFNASHILVETEDQANALIAQLNEGADFAQLARDNSTGPSGPSGGELGWFGPGMMVKPFEDAVLGMDVGAVSQPVQTQFGWHVITLNDARLANAPALDDVRAELEAELQAAAVQDVVDGLTSQADISRADLTGIDTSILSDTSLVAR